MILAGADEQARPIESRAALDMNLARQRDLAAGKRVVNTQGREAVALDDEKPDEEYGWYA